MLLILGTAREMTGVEKRYYEACHVSSWELIEDRPDASHVDRWFSCLLLKVNLESGNVTQIMPQSQRSDFKVARAVCKPGTELKS